MANNYFLTGEKGIGKSTLLNKIINNYSGEIGGFKTVRHMSDDGRVSFHFLDVSKDKIPNNDNLLFYRCENKNEEEITNKFNKFSSALDDFFKYKLILMDEIGPNEEKASVFKEKIIKILDSDVCVIGVLQNADSEFINQIKNRNDTKVFIVTEDNRNKINKMILGIYDK